MKRSKFQIVVISIFIICIIAGVIGFATYKGGGNSTELAPITIWGTFPSSLFDQYVSKLNTTRSQPLRITYVQIAEGSFDKTFIEALARGQGPDAILVAQDLLHKHEDKVIPVPYALLSQRDFQNTFIKQAELYLTSNGILAMPFEVDPLVMYWNRDTFTNAGIALPPSYWDEFANLNTKITQKDVNSNIRRSAIAMGEFNNINHARELLGTLFLQAGNPVTYRDATNQLTSALGSKTYDGLKTSQPALDFYTQFSNPSNANYSWNRSLPSSRSSFLSGNLATYFGFASEIKDLRDKNPNIDFDATPIPQARGAKNRAVYGLMYGFSLVRSTKDVNSAYAVISQLLSVDALTQMVTLSYLPPVRRDMLAQGSTDPYLAIFYDSALISRGWLDTNKVQSNAIFQKITESVTSGRKNSMDALQAGSDEFDISLKNI